MVQLKSMYTFQASTLALGMNRPLKQTFSSRVSQYWSLEINCTIEMHWSHLLKRMHSSGMRTACLLTVSQYALHRGGVCPGGGCLPMGVVVCVCVPACNGADPPPSVDRQTPAVKSQWLSQISWCERTIRAYVHWALVSMLRCHERCHFD